MARGDSILCAGRAHAYHFLGTQVGGDKSQSAYPCRQRAASLEEVLTRFHEALQGKTNAQHENEVQEHDEPIDKGQVHCLLLRPFYRSQNPESQMYADE